MVRVHRQRCKWRPQEGLRTAGAIVDQYSGVLCYRGRQCRWKRTGDAGVVMEGVGRKWMVDEARTVNTEVEWQIQDVRVAAVQLSLGIGTCRANRSNSPALSTTFFPLLVTLSIFVYATSLSNDPAISDSS